MNFSLSNYGFVRPWRLGLNISLVGMILARLVWLELRPFPSKIQGVTSVLMAPFQEAPQSPCQPLAQDFGGLRADAHGFSSPASLLPAIGWLSPATLDLVARVCLADGLGVDWIFKINQNLILGSVFLATLMVRIITSSWMVALISGATLMSRGHLLAAVDQDLHVLVAMFTVTFWLMACVHFLRSGSMIALSFAGLAFLVGVVFEPSLLGLAMVIPALLFLLTLLGRYLTLPILQSIRLRLKEIAAFTKAIARGALANHVKTFVRATFETSLSIKPNRQFGDGGLFRPIDAPFSAWVRNPGARKRLFIFWPSMFLLALFALTWLLKTKAPILDPQFIFVDQEFLINQKNILQNIDFHFLVSLMMVALCTWQPSLLGLTSFMEATWLFALAMVLVVAGAMGMDYLTGPLLNILRNDLSPININIGSKLSYVFLWFEPAILAMGIAGVYNLIKVADSWALRRIG